MPLNPTRRTRRPAFPFSLATTGVILLLVSTTAAGSSAAQDPSEDSASPRGIIVFIADDQGGNDAGCYGNAAIRTPNLDRLADGGILFRHAFLTTSSCSPSRSSILTGRYPHATEAEDLHTPLPDDQPSIASYLRPAGYYCAAVGKWHLGDAEKAHWDLVEGSPPQQLGERTIRVLRELPADQPFFLWIASTDPHRGYSEGAVDPPHDPDQVIVPPFLADHAETRRDLALYYDEISRFDEQIGAVLDYLDQESLAEDTLVLYLSDNGMPFPRAKTTLYDSGIRTPLLVRWPRATAPGQVRSCLVSSIDLGPTLLELAGIEQDTMQGRSFATLLRNDEALDTHRHAVFAEANWHDYEQFTRAVRTERFKLVRNYYWDKPLWQPADSVRSPTWQAMEEAAANGTLTAAQQHLIVVPRPFEELYDLERDPYELDNVIGEPRYERDLNRLRTWLDNWRVDTNDVMPPQRRRDGFNMDGNPLPHNQPFYDNWLRRQQRGERTGMQP